MLAQSSRHRSLYIYHLHMGGPDADAQEWKSLLSPRFAPRLEAMGITHVTSAANADVVLLTGLLTSGNLDAVLEELSRMPSPSAIIAAGDAAINGGAWAKAGMPGLPAYSLAHYADVQVSVPGDPPTPQALIAALAAAAELLSRPAERPAPWQDE